MKKILLCILDGFGYSKLQIGNAVNEAKFVSNFFGKSNAVFLEASGKSVGLPVGQFGNSEVGHMTIGAGRILKQKLEQITDSILSKDLDNNDSIAKFLNNVSGNTCHVMCLFSNGCVHSCIDHIFWALDLLRKKNINIKAHLFLDGRDVQQKDAVGTLNDAIKNGHIKISEIATIQGRFYAMDRDNRMERTKAAYDLMVRAKCFLQTNDPVSAIQSFYDQNIYDEMIPQILVGNYSGADENASFWMLNFRTDRIKQILRMLQENNYGILNMVSCDHDIDQKAATIFQPKDVKNTIGEILSNSGVKQLRIAETEKYAHVTYFFNGGLDFQYPNEDRILVKSPNVSDYALTPDMSSQQISDAIVDAMRDGKYDVVVANFASPDMIGHTGNFEAAKKSLRLLDEHIKNIVSVASNFGYAVILTADHGNAEEMISSDSSPQKTHTTNPVPFIFLSDTIKNIPRRNGGLSDIAPTVLKYIGIDIPEEMTGQSLV